MTDLLKFATDAHGGLDRWYQLKTLKAHLSVTGAIWHVKGKPDVVKDIQIELPIHEQYMVTHLVGQSKRFVFTPHQVAVEGERGNLIAKLCDPRRAFEGHSMNTPWDDLHVAYFDLAEFGVAHAFDHYGQMVECLRMNGIVPPASRGKSE